MTKIKAANDGLEPDKVEGAPVRVEPIGTFEHLDEGRLRQVVRILAVVREPVGQLDGGIGAFGYFATEIGIYAHGAIIHGPRP